jgi:hypothetical protein
MDVSPHEAAMASPARGQLSASLTFANAFQLLGGDALAGAI